MAKPLDLRDKAIQAWIDGDDDEVTFEFDLLTDLAEPFGTPKPQKPNHLCIKGQTLIKGRPICKICGWYMD